VRLNTHTRNIAGNQARTALHLYMEAGLGTLRTYLCLGWISIWHSVPVPGRLAHSVAVRVPNEVHDGHFAVGRLPIRRVNYRIPK
jgi:hypothetical protein